MLSNMPICMQLSLHAIILDKYVYNDKLSASCSLAVNHLAG